MTQPPNNGPRGDAPGPSPIPTPPTPEERRKVTRRIDLIYGIALFVMGIVATISSMTALTENALAAQAAAMFEQYEAGDYVRADGLAWISLAGIIVHPLNYALWLWIALGRWRAEKLAAWCAIVGAIVGWLMSTLLVTAALMMHPQLTDAVLKQAGLGG